MPVKMEALNLGYIPVAVKNKLRKLASAKGLLPTTYARMLLVEAIEAAEAAAKGGRK